MSTEYDYDLYVVGAGSGGVRASRMSAQFGARVAICEGGAMGGTCVNVGCVPKKLLVYGSQFSREFQDAQGFGWTVGERSFDWNALIANKDNEIKRLNGIYDRILGSAGVEVHKGWGKVVDPHTVEVDGKRYTAERILIATGGWPFVPDIPGKELVVTSNEAFYLDELPKRIVIVGGGYIGVEFAGIFEGMGSQVTLVTRADLPLRGFDHDLREFLAEQMKVQGIEMRASVSATAVHKNENGLDVTLSDGHVIQTDCVMFATGRVPRAGGIGLEEAGVELDRRGAVVVDEHFQTTVPSIYAIGDVINRVTLTPVALAEGMLLARRFFGQQFSRVDYENIPTAVFSNPNIGTVGLTEEEARDRFGEVTVYRSKFTPMKLSLSPREGKTLMKLLVNPADNKVVGCHMAGPDAGEIIQGLAVAIKCGATKAQFDATIGIHPTAAEEFVTMRTPVS